MTSHYKHDPEYEKRYKELKRKARNKRQESQKYEARKDYFKSYYEKNKEAIRKQQAEYRQLIKSQQ